MIVVADTTPINYLILIEEIDLLPKLYGRVIIPRAVNEELMRSRTPLKAEGTGVDEATTQLGGNPFTHCCHRCRTGKA